MLEIPDFDGEKPQATSVARYLVRAAMVFTASSYAVLLVAVFARSWPIYWIGGAASGLALCILASLVFSETGRNALWPVSTDEAAPSSIYPAEFFWHVRFQIYLTLAIFGPIVLIGSVLESGFAMLPLMLLGYLWPISHPIVLATTLFNSRLSSRRPRHEGVEDLHQRFLPKTIREGRIEHFKALDLATKPVSSSPNPDTTQSED
jgi:hypothetical protein